MVYVVSDIHGEYEAYKKLLEKINFSSDDDMYILGDCIDRGDEPIKLLQDMMLQPNVFPVIGNHEYMAIKVLKSLMEEVTEESVAQTLSPTLMQSLLLWQENGGGVTLEQFQKLSIDDRHYILEYLEDFSLYETVEVNGESYVLVHAGLDNFREDRPLDDYSLHELIFNAPDYDRVYFKDKYLVTGHMPAISQENNSGQVIIKNNHISIDCGKVFGGKLAAFCLDTHEAFYV